MALSAYVTMFTYSERDVASIHMIRHSVASRSWPRIHEAKKKFYCRIRAEGGREGGGKG